MYICDENFLAQLSFEDETQRLELIKGLLGCPAHASSRVRVLVLADLHLGGGDRESLGDRLAVAKEWFRGQPNSTKWDALVIAGDLVAGNQIGWSKTDESSALAACHEKLAGLHQKVGEELARIALSAKVLAVPGNHDIVRKGGKSARRKQMAKMLKTKGLQQWSSFLKNVEGPLVAKRSGGHDPTPEIPWAPRLLLVGGGIGVVAIIGLDSNRLAYEAPGVEEPGCIGGEQLELVRKLVEALRKVFCDRPMFLWSVWHHHLLPVYNSEQTQKLFPDAGRRDPSPGDLLRVFDAITVDGRSVVDQLCESRFSLATHGHMHAPSIQRVSYKPQTDKILNVVACPSCVPNPDDRHPFVGATLVEIDLERALAEISIKGYQWSSLGGSIGAKRKEMHEAFALPLVSASRVPLGEMRLLQRLEAWISGERPTDPPLLCAFPRDLPLPPRERGSAGEWELSVRNCLSETGYVPVCMGTPEEVVSSGLLKREQLASLPRKRYKLLLCLKRYTTGSYDVLLNNFSPLRTSDYGSWDAPLLPAFKTVDGLVGRWLLDVRRRLDEYRKHSLEGASVADDIEMLERILGKLVTMQECDEELVTIATRQFVRFSPTEGIPTIYEYSLTHWPLLSSNSSCDAGGLVTRFLGEKSYVARVDSTEMAKVSFRDYSRGLVWVPLARWRESDAIRSRNSDVMKWVDETLAELSRESNAIPQWLILGSGSKLDIGIKNVELKPFGWGERGRGISGTATAALPNSLVSGLDDVMMGNGGAYPYRGQEIRMGVLRLEENSSHGRLGIGVYFCDGGDSCERAGALRPVQRYVLSQGLRRAADLRAKVNSYLSRTGGCDGRLGDVTELGATQGAGYLKVTLNGGREIAVLPLVVEQIAVGEQEGCEPEFILCDGNHRLVQYLLRERCGSVGCAIVWGEPRQPYYAWPYSRFDWNIISVNQLETTPDLFAKYTPRYPEGSTSEDIRRSPERYREFFRDFSTGFIDIGGQGGRVI